MNTFTRIAIGIMKLKNILSLFDGISAAQLALNRAGITYDNYYASEIDPYPISISNIHNNEELSEHDTNWECSRC